MASPLLYDLDLLPPGSMTGPRIVGGTVESGSSLSGVSTASDVTGGGFVALDYDMIWVGNTEPAKMRAAQRLSNALAGGVRQIVVPLLVDFFAPVALGAGQILSKFSDSSMFSDGSEFSQPPVAGIVIADAAVGAGSLQVSVIGGTTVLQGGEWFGLNHTATDNPYRLPAGFRAYNVTDATLTGVDGTGNNVYTIAIRPTLRDPIAAGAVVDWWRPRCTMRLKPGFAPSIQVEKYWYTTPSFSFVEAF